MLKRTEGQQRGIAKCFRLAKMPAEVGGSLDTPLRLVTLFRDREPYQKPQNLKLATWKQDLNRRLQELDEYSAVRSSSAALSSETT